MPSTVCQNNFQWDSISTTHVPETEGPKYCSQYKIQDLFLVHAFLYKEYTRSCFYDLLPIFVFI